MTLPRYEILDSPDQDQGGTAQVMICEGPYEAFVYRYGKISIEEEDNEEDGAQLQFDYELESAPGDYQVEDEDKEKVDFENLIGDILVDIISKAVDKQDGFDLDNPSGTDD